MADQQESDSNHRPVVAVDANSLKERKNQQDKPRQPSIYPDSIQPQVQKVQTNQPRGAGAQLLNYETGQPLSILEEPSQTQSIRIQTSKSVVPKVVDSRELIENKSPIQFKKAKVLKENEQSPDLNINLESHQQQMQCEESPIIQIQMESAILSSHMMESIDGDSLRLQNFTPAKMHKKSLEQSKSQGALHGGRPPTRAKPPMAEFKSTLVSNNEAKNHHRKHHASSQIENDNYPDESQDILANQMIVPVHSSEFFRNSQHSKSRKSANASPSSLSNATTSQAAKKERDRRYSIGSFVSKSQDEIMRELHYKQSLTKMQKQDSHQSSVSQSKRKRKQWPNVDSMNQNNSRGKSQEITHEHHLQRQESSLSRRSQTSKDKKTMHQPKHHGQKITPEFSQTPFSSKAAKNTKIDLQASRSRSKDQRRQSNDQLEYTPYQRSKTSNFDKNQKRLSLRQQTRQKDKGQKSSQHLQIAQQAHPNQVTQNVKQMMKLSTNKQQLIEQNTGIDFLINEKKEESRLSKFWSKVVLAIHTYNFVTVFFFLGIEGFPEGLWLLLEIVSEMLIATDFVLRLVIRLKCPSIWSEMWLLHDKGSRSKFHLLLRLVGSIPQSLILCLIYGSQDNLGALVAIQFAILRCLKLLRLRQISQYFEKVDFQSKRSKNQSFLQGLMVVYYFMLATHFIGCIWLLVARLESSADKGWFAMARFNQYNVSTFDKYIESLYFVVATMTGLGYGNIVPSTNPEWLTDCFIMITGASIYANFFANFAVEIYNQNKKQIENNKRFDQAKQFAQQRQVSDDLKKKIRHYYNNLRLNFSDYTEKNEILEELPISLQQELSLVFNRQMIQEVKFFQLAEPNFIMAISRLLKPQISIVGEYVVRIDEVATQIYFINSGLVEVLATDNYTPLAYQGSGCYFGEIGVLITGKRSCSVKIKKSAILSTISKHELLKMLENFPMQAKFLRAVGRQRLQTTHVEDLRGTDASDMEQFIQQELSSENYDNHTSAILNKKMQVMVPNELRLTQNDQKLTKSANAFNSQSNLNFSRQHSTKFQDLNLKPKIWQTKNFNKLDIFLIVPFSILFYLWNSLLLLTVFYDTFMVPFSIALTFDFYGVFYAVDVFAILVYMIDIYMRSKTAITTPSQICLDPVLVMHHYVNSWLILDLLACLPFEYFMLPFATGYMDYIRYVRLFRLCKFGRIYELIRLVQTQSDFPSSAFTFIKLFLFFMLAAHFMACFYIFIGRTQDESDRFDGQTMFKDMLNRNFITLKAADQMSEIELYWQFLYLSSCTMGAVMYGDVIPYTLTEQLFTFLAMFSARIYLAFVFAEAANYLSYLHVNKSMHNQKTKRIETWLKQNNIPSKLVDRVNDFHQMLWNDFQGINEQEILNDLPESLRDDIRYHLLHSLILNWEAFPKNNSRGAMQTVIRNLRLQILPKNEFIIRIGQVAEEMYFIVKGICRVLNEEGEELAILKQGQNFGEMALLDEQSPLRQASVVSITKCSLAVLTKADFELICEMYPTFRNKIFELAKQRKISNLQKEKDAKILKQQTISKLGVVLEEEKSMVSDSSDKNSSEPNLEGQSNFNESRDQSSARGLNSILSTGQIGQNRTRTPVLNTNPLQKMSMQEQRTNSASAVLNNSHNDDSSRVSQYMIDAQQSGGNHTLRDNNSVSMHSVDQERSQSARDIRPQSQQETISRSDLYNDVPETNYVDHFVSQGPLQPQETDSPQKNESGEVLQFSRGNGSEQDHVRYIEDAGRKSTDSRANTDWDYAEDDLGLIRPEGRNSPEKRRVSFAEVPSFEEPQSEKNPDVFCDLLRSNNDCPRAIREQQELAKKGKTNKIPAKLPLQSSLKSPRAQNRPKVHPEPPKQLGLRRQSTMIYSNVDQYINIQAQEDKSEDSFLHRCLSIKNAIQMCITLASAYNMIFIPLSFAFRIPIEGFYLTLEVLTVFFYMVDICLRWSKLNNYYQLEKIPDSRLNAADRKLKNDPELLHRMIRIQKVEIGCSVAGCLPIVSILGFLEIYRPWLLVCLLSSIRLTKIRPIFQVFDVLKDQNLNLWRIVEVLTYYYLICHYLACLLLANAAHNHDARSNWLRRIPVPQDEGIRTESSVFTDMESLSIYVHGIYFVVNTISHVAIGDITSVTTDERVFNAFLILMGTFIYSFLFGNITAIVSSLAPSQNMEFYSQYNYVMNKLKNGKIPLKTTYDVNQYFDYQWSLYKGLNVEKALEQLPDSIKSDVFISRYQDTVETSLLFRESTGQIDVAMTASIFKKFKIQVYHNQEFILKVGQHCTDTLIILDGQVQVYGLNDRQTLGVLSAGSHYSNDLSGDKTQASLAKIISIQKSHLQMESVEDNFDSKSLVHLVAKSFVVVGRLSQSDLQQLYVAYPQWQTMMQTLNRFLFELCKITVEKYCASLDKSIMRTECIKLIQSHLTFSTERIYEDILEMDIYSSQLMVTDLTRVIKHHYIQLLSSSITHEQLTSIQKACMVRHMSSENEKSLLRKEQGVTYCCSDFYIDVNSRPRRVLEFLQLLNLIYIAFSTPMFISFNIKMQGLTLLLEILSIIFSVLVIILNFRTPVNVKGKASLELKKVTSYYWHNGMLIDLCGILPFNLMFRLSDEIEDLEWHMLTIALILQAIRIVSSWNAIKIFAQFEVYVKSHNFLMGSLKATLMLYFLGHWMTCSWHLVNVIEARNSDQTWAATNNLDGKTVGDKYLLCYYTVLNVVTSVGYGDMYPVTDFERVFFILMINAGDVLFALAFGLIAQITMQQNQADENQKFVQKLLTIQQIMTSYNISQSQRERVEQYFSFTYLLRSSSKHIENQDLKGLVPTSLLQEIIFHQNNELLLSMFSDFGSENLIKELSTVLSMHVYLPGDYIINKGEIGEEMYFIVDGEVKIIAADKQTVVTKLRKGQYFGEIAIFFSTKRTSYVQADSFCILNSLKKCDLDRIVKSYPRVARDIQEKTKERIKVLNEFNQAAPDQNNEGQFKGQQMFSNLVDESLLSPSSNKVAASKNIPLKVKSLKIQNLGSSKEENKFAHQASMNGRNQSHFELIEKKANPLIEALSEHTNALGPQSQKLLQAMQDHSLAGSQIQRRSSLLVDGTPNSASHNLEAITACQPTYMRKEASERFNSEREPLASELETKRRSSHRSMRSSIRGKEPLVQEQNEDNQSVYRPSDAMFNSARSGTSQNEDDEEYGSMSNRKLHPQQNKNKAQYFTRSTSGLKMTNQHSAEKTPFETEAVSVRRIKKDERRLSRITLNRNLTLNQTSGLKLQWTVGN